MLILDSGALTRLSARTKTALSLITSFHDQGLWPPVVPTVVLAESLHGHPGRDANTNRFLKTCLIETNVSVDVATRASSLRRRARTGSAVDAIVVALAEPDGTVLTTDPGDLNALAAYAARVTVEAI